MKEREFLDPEKESTIQEKIVAIQTILGDEITSLSLLRKMDQEAQDFDFTDSTIADWINGEVEPEEEAVKKIEALYEFTHELINYDSPQTIRVWFAGMNPTLNDRSPVLVMAEDIEEVRAAVNNFIAYG